MMGARRSWEQTTVWEATRLGHLCVTQSVYVTGRMSIEMTVFAVHRSCKRRKQGRSHAISAK